MKNWHYISILVGALVAFSRYWFSDKYGQLLLAIGMMLILAGIYRISRNLPPKRKEDFEPPMVVTEPESDEKDNTSIDKT